MNGSPTATPTAQAGMATLPDPELIQVSCRVPLLVLFLSAGSWLLLASVFGLVASIKFHSPDFLANSAWLTYGRLYPAASTCLLYGFALQAGLGLAIWLFAELGRTVLLRGLLVLIGASFLNLGVLVGVAGILAGDTTGFETLEMPGYATPILFLGYVLVMLPALLTFHTRTIAPLFASQWFLLAALFWFPWIYCTAQLLLVTYPVRGMTQAVIAWWYSQNFTEVWLGLVGLAAAFYLVPLATNRPLRSRYLALFAFWIIILFSSWAGIPSSAPVPAWMPALSAAARTVTLTLVLAVALNVYGTTGGFVVVRSAAPQLSFVLFGVFCWLLAALLAIAPSFYDPTQLLQFTWFTPAGWQLQVYGFFVMTAFGVIYYALPRLAGTAFRWPGFVRVHFWLAAAGLALTVIPLLIGGFVQLLRMQNPSVPFVDVARSALPFLRVATLGDLLLLAGHVLFVANVSELGLRLARARFFQTYEVATADLFKTEEAKA